MLGLDLPADTAAPLHLLLLGAHCDDIEIGCGGTLLRLVAARANLHVTWVVFGSTPEREQEALAGAERFLAGLRGTRRVVVCRFRDGHFPWHGSEIKERFESLKREIADPDLIFTHCRDDRHQDHRTVSELTWNTWRRHAILEYEIPKYDGDLGSPNCFVPLPEEVAGRKIAHILDTFRSQAAKDWMDAQTFEALMRLRGLECAERRAEAFYCRKFILSPK